MQHIGEGTYDGRRFVDEERTILVINQRQSLFMWRLHDILNLPRPRLCCVRTVLPYLL